MASQIHKTFTTDQVKELLIKYLNKEVERKSIQEVMSIGKSRFFELIQAYRNNPDTFSVEYKRSSEARRIADEHDRHPFPTLPFRTWSVPKPF